MLFNKDIVAYSCKVCLKYILNPEQRVSVTNIINQRIVEVTNFKKLNEYQKFICFQCDKKLIECVKFRTEAISNIERINEMIEAFMSESEDEIDNEENIEDSIIEINQSGYPYKKVFYEEDECCSSLKEVSSIKRKISENDEPCNSREPSVKKLTVEEVQKQLYSEVKKSALSNDTAFKTFLTEICRFRRGANKTWKLMIFCGFKNKESFIEKIKKSLTHEDAIEQMQTVIDRSSRVKLKKIGMKKTIQKFKFTSFQVQTIKDIFNAVEELILSEMTDDCNDNN